MAEEMNTDERAKFEAWHKTTNWPNDLGRHDGRYNSNIAEASCQAWQARAALSPNTEDMATASAQGFRDGVASLSAAEPAIPALQPNSVLQLVDKLVAAESSKTRTHEKYMGKAMPEDEYVRFERLREETIPAMRAQLRTLLAPTLTQGAAIAAGAGHAELPSECDSPEICSISKSCVGQFGSKRICASHGQAPAQLAPEGWNGTYEHAWRMAAQYIMESEAKSKKIWQDAGFTWMRAPSPQAAQQAPAAPSTPASSGAKAHADAHLRAILHYTEGFYGAAIQHGMKAGETANAVAHVESAARALHRIATASPTIEGESNE